MAYVEKSAIAICLELAFDKRLICIRDWTTKAQPINAMHIKLTGDQEDESMTWSHEKIGQSLTCLGCNFVVK